ncbi:MAG: DUF2147 domain-containing protein [Gammaproteobacteria bacterium]|nr:DUF2147 domain-containing protein [Gammaproteobacteria bacterium]
MKKVVLILGLLISSMTFAGPNDVLGVWKTNEGGGHVELYRVGDELQGKIVGGDPDEAKATTDVNNPDPALRERELLGLVIIKDMSYDAKKDAWVDGELYRTTKGKTYKAKIRLGEGGILKVTGYLGFFKKTVDWHRLEK